MSGTLFGETGFGGSVPEAMLIVSREGRINLVNSQAAKLFVYDRLELIGQPLEMLIPALISVVFQNPRTRPTGMDHELFGSRHDGTEFPVAICFSPLAPEQGILVVRDITERQEAERAIQDKTLELENAKQADHRFLCSMGHELRSPLNAIIGFTGLLLLKLSGPLNGTQEDQLKLVEQSANQLLLLIDDLLDLARIESRELDLEVVPVPIQSVIGEVIAACKPLAEQKQLQLTSKIPDEELLVRTDRRALTQILLKLTNNALKFTERGVVHIKLKQHDDGAGLITEISVADTGIGIRSKDQNRLFQAFQKFRGNGKVVQQGNGLGLYVSQKLANLLGGQISFESEPNKGSTFILVIKEN